MLSVWWGYVCSFWEKMPCKIDKRGVQHGDSQLDDVGGEHDFHEYGYGKHAPESDGAEYGGIEQLAEHCGCIVADPQSLVAGALFDSVERPNVMEL